MGGGLWYATSQTAAPPPATSATAQMVSIVPLDSVPASSTANKQVFEIMVKEGYQPAEITARAGVPVILKMKTSNSFDCSTVFSLPQFNFRTQLQSSGEVALVIPAQKAGGSVYGVCGMGMDKLEIKFN